MARLASEAKMAFYPTSVETVRKIREMFIFEPDAQIIDPCCGEGEAVSVFKNDGRLYGVELDVIRAKKARTKVHALMNANAIFGVRRSLDWASLLFLNPPYGDDGFGNRLEHKFIERWGNTVLQGGYMLLIINPNSVNLDIAKVIRNQNYKPVLSFFDPDNEDYKNYQQYFLLFKRESKGFRFDALALESCMDISKSIDINEINEEGIQIPSGKMPPVFKEYQLPEWKIDELIEKSDIQSEFEKELMTTQIGFGSIEELNEGQRNFLIASGAIDEPLIEGDWDKGLILKGTVKKIQNESPQEDDDGDITSVKISENFQTEVFGLDLNSLQFYKYN